MAIVLKPDEIRVLGVLIEKSLAQPAYYPMTLNAITSACNQKSNRDPVMQLTEGEAAAALHGLRQWQLADQADPDRGSRANRFRHDVEGRFGWNAPQRAIMSELMLRGPQTVGELRSHASRMTRLEAVDYVREVLQDLQDADPPMVIELPRQPGKSTARFALLLGGDVSVPETTVPSRPATCEPAAGGDRLEARIDDLAREIHTLRAELDALRDRLRDSGLLA